MWSLASAFTLSPERLVRQLAPGQEHRLPVRLRRSDGKPFRILEARVLPAPRPPQPGKPGEAPQASTAAPTPNLGVSLPKDPAGTDPELTVLVPATLPPGTRQDRLQIRTDDPEEPTLSLPVILLLGETKPSPTVPPPTPRPTPPAVKPPAPAPAPPGPTASTPR